MWWRGSYPNNTGNKGVPLYTKVSPCGGGVRIQIIRVIKVFHCIQRCPHVVEGFHCIWGGGYFYEVVMYRLYNNWCK